MFVVTSTQYSAHTSLVTNISKSFYLQESTGIDMEQNYVTVGPMYSINYFFSFSFRCSLAKLTAVLLDTTAARGVSRSGKH